MGHARKGQTLSLRDNWVRLQRQRHPRITAFRKAGNKQSLAKTWQRVANAIQEIEHSSGHQLVYFPDRRRQRKSRRRFPFAKRAVAKHGWSIQWVAGWDFEGPWMAGILCCGRCLLGQHCSPFLGWNGWNVLLFWYAKKVGF